MDTLDMLDEMDTPDTILNEIDKRIKLRFMKEKRTSRTYIEGIEKFFDEDKIKEMMQQIKKKLSTSYFKRVGDDTEEDTKSKKNNTQKVTKDIYIAHGFSGDHKERIKSLLIETYKIPEDKIVQFS
jgi:translation initiation factor 1 (eIF-1/SUI1)